MASIESRKVPGGGTIYRVKVRRKGYPVQSASFRRLTDARKWAQSIEAAIHEGRHFKGSEAKKHSLAETIDRYLKEVLPHKAKAGANQKAQLAWWKDKLGHCLLADVSSALIVEQRNRLLQESKAPKCKNPPADAIPKLRAPATVVRYLSALSHVFSTAMKEWEWVEQNPVLRVKKPKEPRGRDRFLSEAERTRLLTSCQAISPVLYVVVVLALSTGMRRGEIMGLRWNQVDLQNCRIVLRKTKNGEVRSVPLAAKAHALLSQLSQADHDESELLFPGKAEGKPVELKKPWDQVLKSAGIEQFRFHDLRHSAASYLAMDGATPIDIAAVLGHKTLSMVKRYSHLSDAHTQKIVKRMNDGIFSNV